LRDLEREGVTYGDLYFDEEQGGPGTYRLSFSPAEIYQYVRGIVGWDQYLDGGFEAVADRALAKEAAASASDRKRRNPDFEGACAADFLGEDVEEIVSGWRPDKAQRVRAADPHQDALLGVLHIASSLPTSVRSITDRAKGAVPFELASERDVQDALFFALRSSIEDIRTEEWTPSSAGSSKRIDLAIPSERILIEVKYVRSASHARSVPNELKVDFESYHSHPACGTVVAIIWDADRRIADPAALCRDLSGPRVKAEKSFEVIVKVI